MMYLLNKVSRKQLRVWIAYLLIYCMIFNSSISIVLADGPIPTNPGQTVDLVNGMIEGANVGAGTASFTTVDVQSIRIDICCYNKSSA